MTEIDAQANQRMRRTEPERGRQVERGAAVLDRAAGDAAEAREARPARAAAGIDRILNAKVEADALAARVDRDDEA